MFRVFVTAACGLGLTCQALAVTPAAAPAIEPPPIEMIELDAPSREAEGPGKAPRWRPPPQRRNTCERQSGLPSLHGRGGNDRMYGADVAYQMFGDEDRDFLMGSRGDDEVIGGDDADVLIGADGSDLFVYDTQYASLSNEKGRWSPEAGDTIVDFREVERDKIDLRDLPKYGDAAPATLQWSERTPKAYAVWVEALNGDTVLAIDLDGDAAADQAIRFLGDVRLSPASVCGVETPALTRAASPSEKSAGAMTAIARSDGNGDTEPQ